MIIERNFGKAFTMELVENKKWIMKNIRNLTLEESVIINGGEDGDFAHLIGKYDGRVYITWRFIYAKEIDAVYNILK